ncbi:MAG: cobyric acid synthase [Clostridia bacterium]|nr:cobyric acid synthase [Clostridia bacterium]
MARALMVQGTASHVGKSVLTAALCRILRQDGWRVAPFKAQNMALNAAVTADGGEIGRAQALQAEAAGVEPVVAMNPVLLKPRGDMTVQVVLLGRPVADLTARQYREEFLPRAFAAVRQAYARLAEAYDVIIIEGAGSPAEVNLRDGDIANMRVAALADAPVLLVADIDRGGVFASIVGTLALLPEEERRRVAGLVINKFRGDPTLFEPGRAFLERETGRPVLGVIPWFDVGLDEEDSVALSERRGGAAVAPAVSGASMGSSFTAATTAGGDLDVAVIRLPRVSNFTDLDPLRAEAGVRVRWVDRPEVLGRPDVIILPGTKNAVDDLLYLRATGLAKAVVAAARAGRPVLGICGGYQILGRSLHDPEGLEGDQPRAHLPGLGLLPVRTRYEPGKVTRRRRGVTLQGPGMAGATAELPVSGYEIHSGRVDREGGLPWLRLEDGQDGAEAEGCLDAGGTVAGTLLHGLFDNDGFRRAWLAWLRRRRAGDAGAAAVEDESAAAGGGATGLCDGAPSYADLRAARLDRLAATVRQHLDMDAVYRLLGVARRGA